MTKLERRSIYWDMYVAAVGDNATLFPRKLPAKLLGHLPFGICTMPPHFENSMIANMGFLPEIIHLMPEMKCIWVLFGFPDACFKLETPR